MKGLFFILIHLLIWTSNLYAQAPKKVLVLPFEVYSQQDLSYLKKAIPEMLTSRLFSPNKIQVIDPELVEEELKKYTKINKDIALKIGKNFSADYIIFGSVSVAGDVVSLDAQIVDLSGEKKPAQFFQEIKGLSELIPQLTRFARKSKNYIEEKEEDFYKEDLSLAMAGGSNYFPGRAHPERGYFGYAPYPVRPAPEEPSLEKAKPRFGIVDPTLEESLTSNLIIDLSGNKPRIGFAKSEEEKSKGNQTQAPSYYYYYPPQPNFNYSLPPYYYFQSQPQEKGLLSKMKKWLWPFGEEESRPVYPQAVYPQPVPISPGGIPQTPSRETSQQVQTPQIAPSTTSQPQSQPPQISPPRAQQQSIIPALPPQAPSNINNPWRWE